MHIICSVHGIYPNQDTRAGQAVLLISETSSIKLIRAKYAIEGIDQYRYQKRLLPRVLSILESFCGHHTEFLLMLNVSGIQ